MIATATQKRGKTNKSAKPAAPGVIEPTAVYTLDEFCRRARIGKWALSQMRLKGFVTRKVGSRKYVIGGDFLEYLKQHGTAEE